ncbi:MAG: glycosyltransferase [Candidatus Latescibacteria bacterium]|nr:glycosyltransferase [Candidatus Latescibacterota bacterium]
MLSDLPTISIITPTLNAARTLSLCLESIRAQDYPQDRVEIVIGDGGSSDGTLDVARRYGVDRIVQNPLRTAEAGKAVAVDAARNDVLAFIDSDNLLDRPDWLRRMVAPFADPGIVASEPLEYTYRRTDPLITRYCALMGMNDPLCYFIGNYDRINRISGRWTELPVRVEDRGDYLKVTLDERHIPTIGANGFLVRREPFLHTLYKPYLFDIDVVYDLIRDGHRRIAKVRIGIVHLFAGDSRAFARKQRRRVGDYLHYSRLNLRRYPWGAVPRLRLVRFALSTLLVVPLLVQVARGMARTFDRAWLFHIKACWLTLIIYGWGLFRGRVLGRGTEVDRTGWRQM